MSLTPAGYGTFYPVKSGLTVWPVRSQAPMPDESERCVLCPHLPPCDCPHVCVPQRLEGDPCGAPGCVIAIGDHSPASNCPGGDVYHEAADGRTWIAAEEVA